MKAGLKKIGWSIPLLLVLAAIVYYGYLQQDNVPADRLFFRIGTGDNAETVSAWQDDKGTYYVFLPSYADMRTVRAIVDPVCKAEVDGITLRGETDLSAFTMGETYDIRIIHGQREAEEARICFLKSANVAAMFINTRTGSMERIHEDKDYEEQVRAVLFDEEGMETYAGFVDKLEGRGQSSWNSDKKSYLLTLARAHEMLGMNPAEKWVLISNSSDVTNLRNKVIYDLAGKTGLKWSPSCRYIDLYLNGNYAGLYLLAEKVEINGQRLDLKPDKEGEHISFLCRNELDFRWKSLRNPFLTRFGRTVEITSPEAASEFKKKQIARDVQMMEDAILSGDAGELKKYIDVDSWARKYLIDEIFGNIDSDLASSYFYCDYSDGSPVFYAGPVWDYDKTFGAEWLRNDNPCAFYANTEFESSKWATPYYHALYKNEVFYERMVEIYREELLPLVMELKNYGIGQQAAVIANAAEMNRIRWFKEDDDISGRPIIDFLTKRIAFLNEAWLDGERFFSEQVEVSPDKPYLSYAVRPGEKLPALPAFVVDNHTGQVWHDRDTGETFDFDQTFTRDTVLLMEAGPSVNNNGYRFISILACLTLVGLAASALFTFIWIDCRRSRIKR